MCQEVVLGRVLKDVFGTLPRRVAVAAEGFTLQNFMPFGLGTPVLGDKNGMCFGLACGRVTEELCCGSQVSQVRPVASCSRALVKKQPLPLPCLDSFWVFPLPDAGKHDQETSPDPRRGQRRC